MLVCIVGVLCCVVQALCCVTAVLRYRHAALHQAMSNIVPGAPAVQHRPVSNVPWHTSLPHYSVSVNRVIICYYMHFLHCTAEKQEVPEPCSTLLNVTTEVAKKSDLCQRFSQAVSRSTCFNVCFLHFTADKQEEPEYCSTLLSMMTKDALETDLCQRFSQTVSRSTCFYVRFLYCPAEKQEAPEYCSTLLSMMTEDALETDLCQHVVTLINRALDSPDGPHQGFAQCLALRHSLVTTLLDKGLMRVISDLQDLGQEPIFTVSIS